MIRIILLLVMIFLITQPQSVSAGCTNSKAELCTDDDEEGGAPRFDYEPKGPIKQLKVRIRKNQQEKMPEMDQEAYFQKGEVSKDIEFVKSKKKNKKKRTAKKTIIVDDGPLIDDDIQIVEPQFNVAKPVKGMKTSSPVKKSISNSSDESSIPVGRANKEIKETEMDKVSSAQPDSESSVVQGREIEQNEGSDHSASRVGETTSSSPASHPVLNEPQNASEKKSVVTRVWDTFRKEYGKFKNEILVPRYHEVRKWLTRLIK